MEEKLACIRFNHVGKPYYFSTDLSLNKGDKVVVETVRGLELGELVSDLKSISEFNLNTELKKIIRKANDADLEVYDLNKIKAEQSLEKCKEILLNYDLDMHLVNCEYTLDASKVIFMYTSETRVDFRELLKELAGVFKCRIELRQIGPRDKAKIVGGLGSCGLPLCCNSFLGEFDGVSINMAKNQMLAINIEKISGTCGRLLCCLKYEDDTYTDLKKKFPKIGSFVKYEGNKVKVVGLNVISDLVKIDNDGNLSFVKLDEISFLSNNHHEKIETEEKPEKAEKKEKPVKTEKPAVKKEEAATEEKSKENHKENKPNNHKRNYHNNRNYHKKNKKEQKTN